MQRLEFRAPGVITALGTLLERAWPGATAAQRAEALRRGAVRVESQVVHAPQEGITPGARITADLPRGAAPPPPAAPLAVLAQGPGWAAVDKPRALPSHPPEPGVRSAREAVAEALGLPLAAVLPVHRLDTGVGGVWLIAHDPPTAARLSLAFERGAARKRYLALAPTVAWRRGQIEAPIDDQPARSRFERLATQGALSRYSLEPLTGRTHQLRLHMAALGAPILGDPRYGGVMLAGGLRLWSVALDIDDEGVHAALPDTPPPWPDEPAFAPDLFEAPAQAAPPTLHISASTLKALRGGHPWVLTDTETRPLGAARPGGLVLARAPSGEAAQVCLEGSGRIAARLWSPVARRAFGLETRIDAALQRRRPLLDDPAVEALRLVHGEADALPGLTFDLLGACLVLTLRSNAAQGFAPRALAHLRDRLKRPVEAVVEVIRLDDPPPGLLPAASLLDGDPDRAAIDAHGVVRASDGCVRLALPTGLGDGAPADADTLALRPLRALIAREARRRPGSWLHLAAGSGDLGIAALPHASALTLVDPRPAALERMRLHLDLNPASASAQAPALARREAARFIAQSAEQKFSGIILSLDRLPATERSAWERRRGAEQLTHLAHMLQPEGLLLITARRRQSLGKLTAPLPAWLKPLPLDEALDFPRLPAFPEGQSLDVIALRR